jgi:hypothetical protein
MHRLQSFGLSVRSAAWKFLAPPVALVGVVVGPVARRVRPVVRPMRRLGGPMKGLLRDLAGLVPALLAGLGVFLVVYGLFNYFPTAAGADASPTDTITTATPAPYSLPPLVTVAPTATGLLSPGASASSGLAIATRIVIPALQIDIPIVTSPQNEQYPLCNAAEYLTLGKVYAYPGAPQAVYIYAHARVKMFWNLLVQSKINNGAAMIGMWAEIYTADNQRHIYEINKVIRHVTANTAFADQALAATTDQLWLQTSEGHVNSSTKLQIVATPIGVVAASYADSHPKNTGTVCPDAPFCTASNQGGCRR